MISVVDESGSLVDAQKTFAGPLKVDVFADGVQTELGISSLNSAVYSGIQSENTQMMVSADGLAPIEQKITPAGIASSVTLDVPQKIHVAEPFPYAVHEVDSFGIPIRKLSSNISFTSGIIPDGNHLRVDNVGTESLAAVTRVGADSKNLESFANTFSFSIVASGVTNRIGKAFEIKLESDIDGLEIFVDSSVPYKKIDETTYLFTPDSEGRHNIVFTAVRDGYALAREMFPVFAEKFVSLVIKAIASDGAELNIGQTVELGNITKKIVTPYVGEVRPEFLWTTFPEDFVVGSKGYRLDHLTFGNQNTTDGKIGNLFLGKDMEIVARYQRMVKIEAENAQGSGFYPYGQTVVLSVPPKEKVSFLVRDVFDHWDGLKYYTEPVTFAATQDIKVKAVLKEDYTFLSLIVSSIVSLIFYNVFVRKKGLSIKYYLGMIKFSEVVKIIKLGRKRSAQEDVEEF
jgi:hypothetical protein